MALCRKMYYSVNLILADYAAYAVKIRNIGLDKGVIAFILDIFEIGKIAGLSKLVEIDYIVLRVFVDKQPHYM